jgi:hypothetical protein
VVAQAVAIRYEPLATEDFKYLGAPVPNPGVWMRKELDC